MTPPRRVASYTCASRMKFKDGRARVVSMRIAGADFTIRETGTPLP